MTPFFIQIKCELGKAYEVANALVDAEIASEVYSTARRFRPPGQILRRRGHRHRAFRDRVGSAGRGHQGHPNDRDVQDVLGGVRRQAGQGAPLLTPPKAADRVRPAFRGKRARSSGGRAADF